MTTNQIKESVMEAYGQDFGAFMVAQNGKVLVGQVVVVSQDLELFHLVNEADQKTHIIFTKNVVDCEVL